MKQNKRAIVGLTTYSLLILIFILILTGSYYFSDKYKTQDKETNAKLEIFNSLSSLRTSLIDLTSNINSSLIYENIYDLDSIIIYLNNNSINGKIEDNNIYVTGNISSMGLIFCSNYSLSPISKNNFYFNGSCISLS